ncbi:hypothetical protein P154DRAFT_519236 [Amniculicola lignicola CBS 123094]|uniref:C2H2-type domain-containing protein n=1 Tax=Amniculicola lignicola CBS 123094 TaxID=1392246 RepID=A0A6A5WV04_9PLEO|nr:hypothetical protein P154DRAFT_519236 [Amniculicola lignicola CBS 123094]
MLVDYSWTTRPSFLDAPLLLLLPPSLECHEEAQHAPFGLPLADGLQPPFDYGATGDQRTLIVNLTDQTLASVNGTSQPLLDTNLGLGFTYEDALGQYDPSFDFTAFSNQDLLTTNDIQWPSINKLSVFYDSSLSLFTNFVNDHQLQQTPAMLEQSYAPQEPVFDSEVVPQGNIGPSCDTPSRMIIPRISQPLSDTAIHQPGERISCTHPGCTTIFRRAGDYRRHMKKHRPYDFECSFPGCSKRFWRGDKMRDHAKVHTKGRQGA